MEMEKKIQEFSLRVKELQGQITTEEATKMSLIAPFFQILGYDIFNPNEFCPEYTADVGIKKGEKVDYAIILNGQPVILIEAKSINKKLEKHDSQLFRYFSTTNARFAILTNGIIYKFYSDLSEKNIMDREAFFELNMSNLSDDDLREVCKFSRDSFDEENILQNASILKYTGIFKMEIQRQMNNPNDDFVRFFLKDSFKGMKTQSVIDKFKPVLKKAMQECIDDTVKDRMTALINEAAYSSNSPQKSKDSPSDFELDSLMIVKTILNDIVNMDDISYKQTDSYFAILYQANTRKWIARISSANSGLILVLPGDNKAEVKYKIPSAESIREYKQELIKSFNQNYMCADLPEIDYVYTKWGKYIRPIPYKINLARNFPS